MAAPTFVAEYPTAFNSTASPVTAMSAVVVNSNDVLVGMVAIEGGGGVTIDLTENGAGAWTPVESIAITDYVGIVAKSYACAAETLSVTATSTGGTLFFGANVIRFSGSNGIGASAVANAATGEPTVTLATTQDNSAIVVIVGDWNATAGTQTFTSTGGAGAATALTDYPGDASHYGVAIAYYPDAGVAGSKTVGMSAPTGQKWSMIAVEVKGSVTGQFARPSSDVSAGTWTPSTGASLAGTIDETPFSDTDYNSTTANGTFRVNLGSVSTPDAGARTVRFRAGGSSAKKLIASLIEGAGTTVASATIDPLPAAVTAQSFTVSGAIGNYADLDLSFEVANATTAPTPSVTFGAIGTGANGGTSVLPSYPTGITAGNLLVLTVTSGGTTSPTPSTPSGWTSQGSYVTTDGTYGIDTGPRRVTVFTKPADGTETGTLSVTVTGGDSCRGSIMRISKGQASYAWDIAATGGNYSAAGTAVSVTGSAIDFAPGDLVIVSNGQRVDTATQSAQALAASGITFGTLTNRASVAVTTGNDHRHVIDSRPVSTGTASVAPTWSYTASAACSAAVHFLRIREVPPTEFARVTFAEFEVPAAVAGGAALAGGASAAASAAGAVITTLAVSGAAIAISAPAASMSSSIPLAGSAQSAAAVAGAASIAKPVAGTAASVAAPAGALTTVDALNGVIQVVASPTGALQMVANLSGTALAASAIAAALTTVQAAAGAASASASASGTLGATPAALTGQSISAAVTAAALGTEIRAAGGAASLSVVVGALSGAAATLAGQAATQAGANAALTTVTALAGQVLDATTVQGALGVAAAALQGLAAAQSAATGQIGVQIALSGATLAQALAQANLLNVIAAQANAAAQALASGSLSGAAAALSGSSVSRALAQGDINVTIALQAGVAAQAVLSGGLTIGIPLAAAVLAASAGSGLLGTVIRLVGSTGAAAAPVGALSVASSLLASAAGKGRVVRLSSRRRRVDLAPRRRAVLAQHFREAA